MIDTYRKMLNLKESIIKAMPKIKKAFISFYGEETEDTIFYQELKNKRDAILEKMKDYKIAKS